MRVGSLFSGIGGLDLGLERAGMEIVWQVEIDDYCNKVLEKHWPHVRRYDDIKAVDFTRVERPDLICGGFPCQPVSCAGKRQGDKDERWLWPEFYRAICEARPRWVLVENVPGLLSVADGRLFGGILGDLARSGYDAEWDLLPAAAFGAPHLRFRLFLVAYAKEWKDIIGEPGNLGKKAGSRKGFDTALGNGGKTMADPEKQGLEKPKGLFWSWRESGFTRFERDSFFGRREASYWAVEPDVGRVAHGVSARVDRLKSLGNAVVPQIAEFIGKRIIEAMNA